MRDSFSPGGVTIIREAPVGSAAWQHEQLINAQQSLEARALRMGNKARARVAAALAAGDPSFNVIRATFGGGKKLAFEEVEFAGYNGPTVEQIDAAPQDGQQIGLHDPRSKRDYGGKTVSVHIPERMTEIEMQERLVTLGPVTVIGRNKDECILLLREEGCPLARGTLTFLDDPARFAIRATWTPYPVEQFR